MGSSADRICIWRKYASLWLQLGQLVVVRSTFSQAAAPPSTSSAPAFFRRRPPKLAADVVVLEDSAMVHEYGHVGQNQTCCWRGGASCRVSADVRIWRRVPSQGQNHI